MFKNLKWLRLTPDRPGRGGTKTGIHTFQQDPVNDVRSLTGGHVYQGAWRREFSTVTYPATQALPAKFSQALALHGYVYPSLTDPSATPSATVLSHQIENTPPVQTFIRDVVTGGARMGPRLSSASPAIFQNISGRCFAAEGTGEGMIFDDRTPAIHAQPNQPLGIGTPSQSLQKSVGNGITPYGTGYCYNGSSFINHPNPDNPVNTIIITDNVAISTPNVSFGQYAGVAIVAASPTGNAVTSNTTPFAATGTISITTGTSLVTLSGATWPAGFAYCGLSINFGGFSYVIAEHGVNATAYDINGAATALSNVQLLILGVYDGPTLTNVAYTITGSQVAMPGAASSLKMLTTGTTGYSQTTQSNLVQVKLFVVQANGLFRNLGNISLGPPGKSTVKTTTTAAMGINSPTVVAPGFLATDVGDQIIVDGGVPANGLLVTSIVTFNSTVSVTLASLNTSGGSFTGKKAMWASGFQGVSDAVMDNNVTFNLTSASNPWTAANVGDTIMIAGASAGPVALLTTITGFVNPGQVTVGLKNTSGGAIAAKQAYWFDPLSGATTGPTYAYAWYDPETGHCSNISPLFQIPQPLIVGSYENFANTTPQFQIDPGYISYPNATDGVRFSHILFFRTLSAPGSSTLYPIGSLNPFVGKVHPGSASTLGSWGPSTYHGWAGLPNNYTPTPPNVASTPPNYWYDWSTDSDLLLSGGFRAPQFTNEKPMVLLRGGATQPGYPYAMAYWDRRLWIVNTQDPDVIQFSCDEAQCPLGIPEESFPPTNFLRIPSVDSRVVGIRTVGDVLLITTERWAYLVAGNNESNYRLMKVSASMPGVGPYQMDEFPTLSGAEGEPSTLFYLGRDRKVYQWTFGAQAVPISQPIQDQLDLVLSGNTSVGPFTPLYQYNLSRLHCVSAWGRRLVIVAPEGESFNEIPSLGASQVHAFDIDNQVWSESFHANSTQHAQDGLAPMTTIYGLDEPVNELFSVYDPVANKVIVRSWLRDDTTGTPNYMTITTFPINFDGKKTRKQIVSMNLHATGGSWTGGIFVNEATAAVAATFGAYPDPLESIYAPANTPFDPGATDSVVMAAQFTNPSMPIVGYRFGFVVQKNADQNPAKVYALDIGYIDYEEPGDGDP